MLKIALALCAFAASACQTSPLGREQFVPFPESEVEQMGSQSFEDLMAKQPIDHDPADNAFVKCVADAITAVSGLDDHWDVVVFDSKQINAFALPGGKIGVYSGILKIAATPDQLATVLGHEVGHLVAQHGRERISEQLALQGIVGFTSAMYGASHPQTYQLVNAGLGIGAQFGILLPFSRTQESEADLIGLKLMAKAGFDPEQATVLWENMSTMAGPSPPAWLSDHPSNSARIDALKAHMGDAVSIAKASGKHPSCRHQT